MQKLTERISTVKEDTLIFPAGEVTVYRKLSHESGDLYLDLATISLIRPFMLEDKWLEDKWLEEEGEYADWFDKAVSRITLVGTADFTVEMPCKEILELCGAGNFACLPIVASVVHEKTGWDEEGEYEGTILHAEITYDGWFRKSEIIAIGPICAQPRQRTVHTDRGRCLVYSKSTDNGWVVDLPPHEALLRINGGNS